MNKRLIGWLTFSVFFPLLPFLFLIFLNYANATLTFQKVIGNTEILFLTLVISSSTIRDLRNLSTKVVKDALLEFSFCFFLIASLVSAIMYGVFLYNTTIGPLNSNICESLFKSGAILFIIVLIASIAAQITISKAELPELTNE